MTRPTDSGFFTAIAAIKDRAEPVRSRAPHRGTTILVLGILGLACPLFGPVAWIMGHTDLIEMRAGRMDRSGESITQAGRICGMITTILMAFIYLVFAEVLLSGQKLR